MKLGLDAIVTEALKELAGAEHAYSATFDDYPGDSSARETAYRRKAAAHERIINLAKGLFPAPPKRAKCAGGKPRRTSTSIERAANDSGRSRPRQLQSPKALPPAPRAKVEITIIDDAPRTRPDQTTLLLPELEERS